MAESVYSGTPLIRNNLEGKPSRYAKKSGLLDFSLKICYIGSLQFGCYYSKPCLKLTPYIPETWTNGK